MAFFQGSIGGCGSARFAFTTKVPLRDRVQSSLGLGFGRFRVSKPALENYSP